MVENLDKLTFACAREGERNGEFEDAHVRLEFRYELNIHGNAELNILLFAYVPAL